jgi:hypothetical protein
MRASGPKYLRAWHDFKTAPPDRIPPRTSSSAEFESNLAKLRASNLEENPHCNFAFDGETAAMLKLGVGADDGRN